jgi:hypothetical protein
MAILVPFLLILAIGLSEMAQVFSTYMAVINTARGGIAYAAGHPCLVQSSLCSTAQHDTYVDDMAEHVKVDAVEGHLDTDDDVLNYQLEAPTVAIGEPMSLTITYKLTTFSSTFRVPYFDRMGMPNYYSIRYSTSMPIRYEP